jgi:hypothetical protein
MFGDKQRLGFGQIEYLPGDMGRRHRSDQWIATRGTDFRIMIESAERIMAKSIAPPMTGYEGCWTWRYRRSLHEFQISAYVR